jgi:nitric oxide reductase large subunit
MFKQNVGGIDRIIRIVVGLALIAGYFLNPDASLRWLYLVGIIPLATGVLGTCGLYSLIGISTCSVKRG